MTDVVNGMRRSPIEMTLVTSCLVWFDFNAL